MDVLDRARAYVSKCPPAISGQNGHSAAYNVAVALVHGFNLSEPDAQTIFAEFNRTCQPPWSDAEVIHKLREAASKPHNRPRGFLLSSNGAPRLEYSRPVSTGAKIVAPKFELADALEMPEPLPDATRALLRSCFLAGECVRIVPAVLNEEGIEIPDGKGPTLSRDEWLRKLDSYDGNPNGIWKNKARTGIYVAINPLKVGGCFDADVTAYRHALVEFDGLSVEEQWNIYTQSNLPCSAVLTSGKKSVHAWVRVDAKDKAEYDSRVKVLFDYFSPYGLDPKNRNPSRLSRLPGCVRFDKRQELLALNVGAPSFTQWLADRELASIGKRLAIPTLLAFKSAEDPNNLIGRRWLCRGGSVLAVAQSGVGKSSLSIQAAVTWAFARPFFGIQPAKELRSLIIQHENDEGDSAEMLQGVLAGLGIEQTSENVAILEDRVIIIRERTHTGPGFLKILQKLVDCHKPDLGWIDPLYSYIGDDISNQRVCSEFLCGGLGPITEATGIAWFIMHHTGKPSTDPKSRKGWTQTDYSYAGLGSSILTNWIRASMTLLKRGEDYYELQLGKRGKRAGAKDLKGQMTTRVYLRHSDKGICWEQIDEPEGEGDGAKKAGRPKAPFDYAEFIESIRSENLNVRQLFERAQEFADVGRSRFYKEILPELKERLFFDGEIKTYSAKRAVEAEPKLL